MTVNFAAASGPTVSASAAQADLDIILVGGGLANSLIAWRLVTQRPELRVLVIERGETLGGNHTWSFHQGDVSPSALADMRPFIAASWAQQSVHFPGHSRIFDVGYHAISSEKLHEVLSETLGDRLILDTDVVGLAPTQVTLADQRLLTAKCL